MKQSCFFGLLLLVSGIILCRTAYAQNTTTPPDSSQQTVKGTKKPRPLFAVDSVKTFTLTTDWRPLLKDRSETAPPRPAMLTFLDSQQQLVKLPLTLKVRGNFRRNRTNCPFPPLLIDFPKKATRKTLFAHQNKLKLVTHCQVDEWVVREFMVYKLYNLLTDLSFQAQLARVTYVDSTGKKSAETHWAFLLEDDNDLAKRNRMAISPVKRTTMIYTDSLQMATVAIFEYMIGNTDWSVPYLHNIRLIDNNRPYTLPVPYDFDHAGIVDVSYARPSEQLGLHSVRERVYRGLVYPMPVFQRVFDRLNLVKPQIYALYQNESRLDKSYVKRTLKYLDEFYAIISKPTSAVALFTADVRK